MHDNGQLLFASMVSTRSQRRRQRNDSVPPIVGIDKLAAEDDSDYARDRVEKKAISNLSKPLPVDLDPDPVPLDEFLGLAIGLMGLFVMVTAVCYASYRAIGAVL
jgi:hypothetical protein